ncbi:MAG: alpha/beta hydrolase [Pseudomonadota bacterium]|nr:alpha/beta hydrolase [Pseudomonadota bacterium]MDE3037910.1 alpha/beta hydrolase [Pseudomonadota bacterium]
MKPAKTPPQNARLRSALAEEAKNRAADFLSGVLRYMEAPYARDVAEPPCIWKRGNARVLDYGMSRGTWDVERGKSPATRHAPRRVTVLFIPSLINRYYILDIEKERSLLRFLAAQGLRPLVLDWGAPGEFEQPFGCGDYITDILNPAIDFLAGAAGNPIALVGYCMGGNLALAAAQLKPKQVSALALLATPWDFHCKEFKPFVIEKQWLPMIEKTITSRKMLPADIVQSLFYMTDPWVFEQKFRRFAGLAEDSRAMRDFIALEHWVNDGVPMTANVARDCLLGWAQENIVARGAWRVAGKKIDPKKIRIPAFIAMPQSDHVVPLSCAMPLAQMMKNATISRPSSGHVGMMVGSRAKKELWQPLAEWLSGIV